MEWINLNTSVLDSAAFVGADPVDRGTWLCLLRYCAGQENAGRIVGARAWSDRRWQQLARVTLREVKRKSELLKWEAADLIVAYYPVEKEAEVRRLRSQASNAARLRWQSPSMPQGMPDGIAKTVPNGNNTGNGSGSDTGNAEEKRREEKRKEENNPLPPRGASRKARKPKPGSSAPGEQPEPTRERMLALNGLFRRPASARWDADELESFCNAGLDTIGAEDFAAQLAPLQRYYAAAIPREKDFRRTNLVRVLRNWAGELDRARAWDRDHSDGLKKM